LAFLRKNNKIDIGINTKSKIDLMDEDQNRDAENHL
jgi:hypothetical protein